MDTVSYCHKTKTYFIPSKLSEIKEGHSIEELLPLTNIPDSCKFWMIRTKSGVFFDEFVEKEIIAIGWNSVTAAVLNSNTVESIKESISTIYGDTSPGYAFNKCQKFVSELSVGDIAMIVGDGKVAFAVIEDYFEDTNASFTSSKELEVNEQIKLNLHKEQVIPCPYVKRRHVTIIKTLSQNQIGPILYRATTNHHSLSSLEEYSKAILDACFDLYSYQGKTNIVFRIQTTHPIDARSFSHLSYFATEAFYCKDSQPGDVSISSNLNSPGIFSLTLLADIFSVVTENWKGILLLYLMLGGGDIDALGVKLHFPGVISFIKYLFNRKNINEERALQKASLKEDLESKKLDNELKRLEVNRLQQSNFSEDTATLLAEQFQEAMKQLDIAQMSSKVIEFPAKTELNMDDNVSQPNK